jgi:hypothetical protein
VVDECRKNVVGAAFEGELERNGQKCEEVNTRKLKTQQNLFSGERSKSDFPARSVQDQGVDQAEMEPSQILELPDPSYSSELFFLAIQLIT